MITELLDFEEHELKATIKFRTEQFIDGLVSDVIATLKSKKLNYVTSMCGCKDDTNFLGAKDHLENKESHFLFNERHEYTMCETLIPINPPQIRKALMKSMDESRDLLERHAIMEVVVDALIQKLQQYKEELQTKTI